LGESLFWGSTLSPLFEHFLLPNTKVSPPIPSRLSNFIFFVVAFSPSLSPPYEAFPRSSRWALSGLVSSEVRIVRCFSPPWASTAFFFTRLFSFSLMIGCGLEIVSPTIVSAFETPQLLNFFLCNRAVNFCRGTDRKPPRSKSSALHPLACSPPSQDLSLMREMFPPFLRVGDRQPSAWCFFTSANPS